MHHGTTAHTAPPRTHQHTNVAEAPLTPHAPTSGRPPQGRAAHPCPHTRAPSTWATNPDSLPRGRAAGGGRAHEPRRPSQQRKAPPPGDALPPPPQRAATARNSASCGASAGSPRPHQPRPGNTGRRTQAPCPKGRATGGGTAPDTRCPSQRWKAVPPGTATHQPRGTQPLTGHANQRDSARPPHPHTRAHSTWLADPDSPPSGRAARGGRAPALRRPSQRRKARPPGTPSRHPHSAQRRLARGHSVRPVLGPHAYTNRARKPRTGPRNPGLPPQGTGGRWRDSA